MAGRILMLTGRRPRRRRRRGARSGGQIIRFDAAMRRRTERGDLQKMLTIPLQRRRGFKFLWDLLQLLKPMKPAARPSRRAAR